MRSLGAERRADSESGLGPLEGERSSSPEAGARRVEGVASFYRQYSDRLVRRLRRQGRHEDAEDIVQDTFLRMGRLPEGAAEAIEKPEAYLRSVADNIVKDRLRSEGRRSARLHVVADEEVLTGADMQSLLECRDVLKRLEAAMMRLKPRTREIFLAHRLDGLTYREIAARTGLSVKGVEKQMAKALAQLDRSLRGLRP